MKSKLIAATLALMTFAPMALAMEESNADLIQKWTEMAVQTLGKEKPDASLQTVGAKVVLTTQGAKVTFVLKDPNQSVTYNCHSMGGMDMCM